jgi:hypothetical protein
MLTIKKYTSIYFKNCQFLCNYSIVENVQIFCHLKFCNKNEYRKISLVKPRPACNSHL